MPGTLIHMGTLARPHGIKGEICIDWFADVPLCTDVPLWLQGSAGEPRSVRILACRYHKGRPIARLEGVMDRSAAELLRGQKLLVERAILPELPEDEAYIEDLLGCEVRLPDGKLLGQLRHVECNTAQDIWVIVTPEGSELLFPAQPCFIAGFDVAGRTVHVDPPEGLLDTCLS